MTALANVSNADRELWEQFRTEPDRIADELETAYEGLLPQPDAEIHPPHDAQTEQLRTVKARRLQGFFRSAVMASYESRCCLSCIAVPELLTASHIIPWSHDPSRRTDPTNGLALNALYDRAFDRGLLTFDSDLRVMLSPALKRGEIPDFHRVAFLELEGHPLRLPHRFAPDAKALEYHREMVWGR